jgi:hypothetical protein
MAAALVGILALVLRNPMKNYLKRLEFNRAVSNIKALIQTCQTKAMANPSLHIGVYFDDAKHRAVPFQDRANPSLYQYDAVGDPAYMQPAELKRGVQLVRLAGYPPEIVFRGDGSAYKSMKVVITDGILKDTLDILASTGRVRVLK